MERKAILKIFSKHFIREINAVDIGTNLSKGREQYLPMFGWAMQPQYLKVKEIQDTIELHCDI